MNEPDSTTVNLFGGFDVDDAEHVDRLRRKLAERMPGYVIVEIDPDLGVATVARRERRAGPSGVDTVAPGAKPADLDHALGRLHAGARLVRHDPPSNRVWWSVLDPVVEATRAIVARCLLVAEWDVELSVGFDDTGQLNKVELVRLPVQQEDKLTSGLARAARTIGHSGWRVSFDGKNNTALLRAGPRLMLPERAAVQWDQIASRGWGWLPFGTDGYKRTLAADLETNPHLLVSGITGSGKTITVTTLVGCALASGCELVVCDPVKGGPDFRWLRPFVRDGGWGCESFDDAAQVLHDVYDEVRRRQQLIVSHDATKWSELPDRVREAERVRPVLVVVDELTSLAAPEPVPKGLPKDDELVVEAFALNAAKARCFAFTSKIAREARSAGVHLIAATQRFAIGDIGQGAGTLRAQLGCRLLLGEASSTEIGMAFVFPGRAEAAYRDAHQTAPDDDDDESGVEAVKRPGRGIAEITGAGHHAFQGWFASTAEWLTFLDTRGVARHGGDGRPRLDTADGRTVVHGGAATPDLSVLDNL